MKYYRRKPVPVIAVQWRGDNQDEVRGVIQPILRHAWGDWQENGPYFACDDEDWDGTYNTCQFYWDGDDREVDPGVWIVFEVPTMIGDHPHLDLMSDRLFRKEIEEWESEDSISDT